MDALSQLLQTLHLDVVGSRHVSLHGPYGARFAPGAGPQGLFMVLDGEVWLEPEGHLESPLHLAPGDIGLYGGPGIIVRDSATPRSRPVDVNFEPSTPGPRSMGGPGQRTVALLGVRFDLEAGAAAPLLAALSPAVPRRSQESLAAALMPSFQRVCEDFESGRPGAHALIQHVTQLLLAEWVRTATPPDAALAVGRGRSPIPPSPRRSPSSTASRERPGRWTASPSGCRSRGPPSRCASPGTWASPPSAT